MSMFLILSIIFCQDGQRQELWRLRLGREAQAASASDFPRWLSADFTRVKITGTEEATSKKMQHTIWQELSDVFSLYYGHKYFGEEAKPEKWPKWGQDIRETYAEKQMAVRRIKRKQSRSWIPWNSIIGYPEKGSLRVTMALKVDDKSFFEKCNALSQARRINMMLSTSLSQ